MVFYFFFGEEHLGYEIWEHEASHPLFFLFCSKKGGGKKEGWMDGSMAMIVDRDSSD
jgi:hypothetical protein